MPDTRARSSFAPGISAWSRSYSATTISLPSVSAAVGASACTAAIAASSAYGPGGFSGQPAQRAQRERDLRLRRAGWMTRCEDEAQLLVGDTRLLGEGRRVAVACAEFGELPGEAPVPAQAIAGLVHLVGRQKPRPPGRAVA
jgi:hypothetical protein